MSKAHQQIKVLRISFVLYELFQKFRYLLLFKRSLNIFYQRRIKVISMMNDELFKNFTISCNNAIGTTQSYELSLRKYCIYFDMSLKELLEEAEEDEMKGVKWKHSSLKSKLVEYRHHMFQNYAAGTVKKEMNCIIFFYKFYDIEVWDLPKVNDKSIQKPATIYFKNLPDEEVIMEAFQCISSDESYHIVFMLKRMCSDRDIEPDNRGLY